MNYSDLKECEKSSLIQLFYIESLELLIKLDDFYKKQRVGIRVGLPHGVTTSIIPQKEREEIQMRVISEVRLRKR